MPRTAPPHPRVQGWNLTEDQALDVAEKYLGEGYRQVSSDRYVSADGSRIVRYGNHETEGRVHHIHGDHPVTEVPLTIDGAEVLQTAGLASATPTGRTRHVVGDAEVNGFAGLAIAQYQGDEAVYLFYCDADWAVVTDTLHESVEAAIRQAEFEFDGLKFVEVQR
jgi:hypothetical protein